MVNRNLKRGRNRNQYLHLKKEKWSRASNSEQPIAATPAEKANSINKQSVSGGDIHVDKANGKGLSHHGAANPCEPDAAGKKREPRA